MKHYFDGKVEHGKLTLWNQQEFTAQVQKFEGCAVQLSLSKGKTRTSQQNRFLFGVCYKLIADYLGESPDTIHEILKAKFLHRTKEITNRETSETETIEYAGSTTKLTTIEFGEYVENIQRWASEFLSVIIPDPDGHAEETRIEV